MVKNKKGFLIIETLMLLGLIIFGAVGSFEFYKIGVKSSEEGDLYASLISLERVLETRRIENGLIGFDSNNWREFQQKKYNGRDLYVMGDKISKKIRDVYYKQGEGITGDIFCIGFKPITSKYIKMAKNDDGVSNKYLEICNKRRTSINLSDPENSMVLKANYINERR